MGAAGLPQRRHRLPRMQAAGDRRHPARTGAHAANAPRLPGRPSLVRNIIADGCEKPANWPETMRDVRAAMGLEYN